MGLCLPAEGREGKVGCEEARGGIAALLPQRVRPRRPAEPRAGSRRLD